MTRAINYGIAGQEALARWRKQTLSTFAISSKKRAQGAR